MLYVILDSSASYLSVGIADEHQLIDYVCYEAWQNQSEKMIPELENLLKKNNYQPKDISDVIVGIGPGSYTGIRIALTTAKIICLSLKANLYTVSSLQILKEKDNKTICLMDARSGRSYFAVYEGSKCIEVDQIKTNEEVLSFIKDHPDYSIKGELSYLGMPDNVGNTLLEAYSLKDCLHKEDNPLATKPVYMRG